MLLVMVKFYHLKDCGNGDGVDSVDDGENLPYERPWKE